MEIGGLAFVKRTYNICLWILDQVLKVRKLKPEVEKVAIFLSAKIYGEILFMIL